MKGLFSVYFYDVAPGQETLYEHFSLFNSTQPGWNTGMGTQDFDSTCYFAAAAGTGPNANCGVFPQLSTTNVQRTLGWHLFEINVGETDINMYIDGVLVHTLAGDYSFDQVTLGVFGPGFRPDTVAYFDNFSVNGYTDGDVPEPGTWAMLVIGGLGMAVLRPRKR